MMNPEAYALGFWKRLQRNPPTWHMRHWSGYHRHSAGQTRVVGSLISARGFLRSCQLSYPVFFPFDVPCSCEKCHVPVRSVMYRTLLPYIRNFKNLFQKRGLARALFIKMCHVAVFILVVIQPLTDPHLKSVRSVMYSVMLTIQCFQWLTNQEQCYMTP